MNKKKVFQFSLLVILLLVWSLFIFIVGTERIVEFIGVSNTYLVLFLVGTFGGVSTITSASFYSTLTTFAHGGAKPLILGLVGGVAITIGDSLFFLLGKKGEESLPKHLRESTGKFSSWLEKKPGWIIPLVTLFYSGFTPLPNDILMVSLGVSRYRYLYILLPLLLGNIILTSFVAYSVSLLVF